MTSQPPIGPGGAAGEEDSSSIKFPDVRAEALIESGVVAAMAQDFVAADRRARAALDATVSKGNIALERKALALLAHDLSAL